MVEEICSSLEMRGIEEQENRPELRTSATKSSGFAKTVSKTNGGTTGGVARGVHVHPSHVCGASVSYRLSHMAAFLS